MHWYKKAQETRWFEWEDNNGETWEIDFKNIEPSELYDQSGHALSDEEIMKNMIISIQNKFSDEPISPHQKEYWLEKFKLDTDEFFEKVQEANNLFEDERRIEKRDMEMGLYDNDK